MFIATLAGDTRDVASGEGNGNPLQYLAWEIPWTEEPESMG